MKLPKDMLQLAEHILETKAGDFEPERFEDRYENAVVEMIQRKRAGMPVPTERIAAPAPNVVSLMDALKRSLATDRRGNDHRGTGRESQEAEEKGCWSARDASANCRQGDHRSPEREGQTACQTCHPSAEGRLMPMRRAHYYRKKAEECRLQAAAAKHAEVEKTLQRLAAQWERLARELDAAGQQATGQQAQQPRTKKRS